MINLFEETYRENNIPYDESDKTIVQKFLSLDLLELTHIL